MKQSDIKVAIALVINGALRANETSPDVPLDESEVLKQTLQAIAEELEDWGENLTPGEQPIVEWNGP